MGEKKNNEIYLTYQKDDLHKICDKIKETEENADTEKFLAFMLSGLFNYRVMPFVQYNGDDLVACAVVGIAETPMERESVLYIHFAFIDVKYPYFWRKGMLFLEDLARSLKIQKILMSTKRSPEAFERKYQFKKSYTVMEKEVI
ncbi:MAG: hypothetical protein RBQ86_07855 [Candidatus Izemoplasmatales bacterium]|nr:hypothetical protein [Candidatus Izemoplasmatales bacterium]